MHFTAFWLLIYWKEASLWTKIRLEYYLLLPNRQQTKIFFLTWVTEIINKSTRVYECFHSVSIYFTVDIEHVHLSKTLRGKLHGCLHIGVDILLLYSLRYSSLYLRMYAHSVRSSTIHGYFHVLHTIIFNMSLKPDGLCISISQILYVQTTSLLPFMCNSTQNSYVLQKNILGPKPFSK